MPQESPWANSEGYLYNWGPIYFRVWPLNVHELDHATETSWAPKEIAGAALYREWVGEGDEILAFRGRIFPYHRIGGLDQLDALEANRRAGRADVMIRGDGYKLGWYVIERLVRESEYFSAEGIGQQIHFEVMFARVPGAGDPALYASSLNSVLSA